MMLRDFQAATGLNVNVNSTTYDRVFLLTNGQKYVAAEAPRREPYLTAGPVSSVFVETSPDQSWFWTEEWQAGEREAEEDLRQGRYQELNTVEDIDAFFDSL